MKKQKGVLLLLVFCIVLNLTGCKQTDNSTESKDVDGQVTAGWEPIEDTDRNDETEDEAKEMILEFYATLSDLDEKCATNSFEDLRIELNSTKGVIERFNDWGAENQDSEYITYYDEITSNPAYEGFVETYIDNKYDINLDYRMTWGGHAYVIKTYMDVLLDVIIPFDNEIQIERTQKVNDAKEAAWDYLNYVNANIDFGVNATYENEVNYERVLYQDVSKNNMTELGEVLYCPYIQYNFEQDVKMFYLFFGFKDTYDCVISAEMTNGQEIYELHSFQIVGEYGPNYLIFYREDWASSQQEEFDKLCDFIRDERLDICFHTDDGDANFSMKKEDIEQLKSYCEMFRYLTEKY